MEGRVALTCKVVAGLSTDAVARAFLTTEATMGQRLLRAKRKIAHAGIGFRVPDADVLPERLDGVLAVVYLVFTTGWSARDDDALAEEAVRLGRLLVELMPDADEPRGLLALMLLQHARRDARLVDGELVTLEHQDRSRWDPAMIAEALALTGPDGERGPYRVQADLAAVHARAPRAEDTDWPAVVELYDELLDLHPSPVVALNRAVAVGMAHGPERRPAGPRRARRRAVAAGLPPGAGGARRPAGAGRPHHRGARGPRAGGRPGPDRAGEASAATPVGRAGLRPAARVSRPGTTLVEKATGSDSEERHTCPHAPPAPPGTARSRRAPARSSCPARRSAPTRSRSPSAPPRTPTAPPRPEELIAAAHTACYAMQLSAFVAQAGGTPQSLDVSADVTLGPDKADGGFKLTGIKLTVRGEVEGLDEAAFADAAEKAKAGCPVSKALTGVDITLDAALES